jgi:hypothetical protein
MEIIVALVVIGLVGYWMYTANKAPAKTSQLDVELKVESAPYKVETPVPAGDVAPQPIAVEGAGAVEVPAAKPAKAKKAPAKKPAAKPAAKKPAAPKKPAAKKAPAKKKPSA